MSERHEDQLLAALTGLLPDKTPAPDTAARLRQRVLTQAAARAQLQVQRAGEGDWQPLAPGIAIKTLRRDEARGVLLTLWRCDPGAMVPEHANPVEEECLVLEGSIEQGGVEYAAGDFLYASAGSRHATFRSPNGALLLIRSAA